MQDYFTMKKPYRVLEFPTPISLRDMVFHDIDAALKIISLLVDGF
jgi:hypothetical protein